MIDKNLLTDITVGLWFTLGTLLIAWFILCITSKVSGNPKKLKKERQNTGWFIKHMHAVKLETKSGRWRAGDNCTPHKRLREKTLNCR